MVMSAEVCVRESDERNVMKVYQIAQPFCCNDDVKSKFRSTYPPQIKTFEEGVCQDQVGNLKLLSR